MDRQIGEAVNVLRWQGGRRYREVLAELDRHAGDQFLQMRLALEPRHRAQIMTNEVEQVGIFLDYKPPIVRTGAEGRELASGRWGMPSSSKALIDATKTRQGHAKSRTAPMPDGGNLGDGTRTQAGRNRDQAENNPLMIA